MDRKASVADMFYPADAVELGTMIDTYLKQDNEAEKRTDVKAIIAPHAGYIYSGAVAGSVYSKVEVPENIILIGPNHTGVGERVSLMATGSWQMPFGVVEVHAPLASSLVSSTPLIKIDTSAHLREHSLEVQLPFLQRLNKCVKIAPITVMAATADECIELGQAIGRTITTFKDDILIVVSSDMNHYEAEEVTREKDRLAIETVLALDSRALLEITEQKHISMCGVLPTAIAIEAALSLGANKAELIEYATSGTVSGEYDAVVGYAGLIID